VTHADCRRAIELACAHHSPLASEKAFFINGANYRVDGGSVAAE
jgi:hypothetical protein